MAKLDVKLEDWFKKVDQKAKEVKTKKTSSPEDEPGAPDAVEAVHTKIDGAVAEPEAGAVAVATIDKKPADSGVGEVRLMDDRQPEGSGEPKPIVESRAEKASAPVEEPVDFETLTIEDARSGYVEIKPDPYDSGVVSEPHPIADESTASLFEDEEIPQVEDFFSFLNEKDADGAQAAEAVADSADQKKLLTVEGTGEPRPIKLDEPADGDAATDDDATLIAAAANVLEAACSEMDQDEAEIAAQSSDLQKKWDRMPHHLQVLFGAVDDEVAQNSYKRFKEDRGELIQRLLDPVLTLEETARILNVCPTTVRRYTNKGALQHFRTEGNQRRFKLSHVLEFMAVNNKIAQAAE